MHEFDEGLDSFRSRSVLQKSWTNSVNASVAFDADRAFCQLWNGAFDDHMAFCWPWNGVLGASAGFASPGTTFWAPWTAQNEKKTLLVSSTIRVPGRKFMDR